MDDYKKLYEQALERAKQFSEKPYLEDSAGIVEYIFPELKESEDERIRLGLINAFEEFLRQNDYDKKTNFKGVKVKEVLAWLEKQGKCQANHDDEIMINQLTEFFTTGKGLQNTNETIVEWLNDVRKKLCKQGEQKLVEWDESIIDETISLINNLASGYGEKVDEPITFNGVKMINNIMERLRAIKPQPKQEWSEEDERQWNNIWDVLDGRFELSKEGYKDAANWFKSIKDRYTWKPSDEQISVLSRSLKYINTISQNYCHVLGELLAQLKKLRGE